MVSLWDGPLSAWGGRSDSLNVIGGSLDRFLTLTESRRREICPTKIAQSSYFGVLLGSRFVIMASIAPIKPSVSRLKGIPSVVTCSVEDFIKIVVMKGRTKRLMTA